ncbi:hypothetical protein [Rufibacter roseolus]|uniref:hypothetical protein n=1 Tax=Rufibacter roseolus TaxID=2817375 RepID=UPI001B300CFA|nr:hypothetical protein [Rufibacter roseolus]
MESASKMPAAFLVSLPALQSFSRFFFCPAVRLVAFITFSAALVTFFIFQAGIALSLF